MEEPASALAGQPTTNQSTAGDRTRPSTATTAQHYHTYKSEEEVEDDGREFHAASRLAPSAAAQIPWRPAVPVGMLTSTEHKEEPLLCTATPERPPVAMIKHPSGKLLHLLHAAG